MITANEAKRTLLAAALTAKNMQAAWKRVKANSGTTGVDGLDIEHMRRTLQRAGNEPPWLAK